MPTGFTPLDLVMIGSGIVFYLVVRKYISRTLKVLFKYAIMLLFAVLIYGLASSISQFQLDQQEYVVSSIEFFQEFMGDR